MAFALILGVKRARSSHASNHSAKQRLWRRRLRVSTVHQASARAPSEPRSAQDNKHGRD